MTTKDEALKQALDALCRTFPTGKYERELEQECRAAIAACRAALAQKDEQEPVAWMLECPTMSGDTGWILSWSQSGAGLCDRLRGEEHEKPLYTAPPKSQPLTEQEINDIAESMPGGLAGFMKGWGWQQFARAIEAAHEIGVEHDAMG